MVVKENNESGQWENMHIERVKVQYAKKKKLNVTIHLNNTKIVNSDYVKNGNIKEHN